MKVGIDISQIVYEGTGVANYTKNLVENLLRIDKENGYVLFASSLRRNIKYQIVSLKRNSLREANTKITNKKVKIKTFKFPPTLLDILWNKLHIFPIEWFIGPVDVFLSSDWTQPPTIRAKKVTTIHDLSIFKFPGEHHPKIVATQKRRLKWVKKECDLIICDSLTTKKDAIEILGIEEKRLRVIYPSANISLANFLRS